jgi:hypothetical protein
MANKHFVLIVLCHSVTPTDAAILSITARKTDPPAVVLQVVNDFDPEEERALINCDALIDTHPAALTDCVRNILAHQPIRKSPRSTPKILDCTHSLAHGGH